MSQDFTSSRSPVWRERQELNDTVPNFLCGGVRDRDSSSYANDPIFGRINRPRDPHIPDWANPFATARTRPGWSSS